MTEKIVLEKVYVSSEDVVARVIEDELIIVPITAGVGSMEDELFSLNETGKAVWAKLDGAKSLTAIIDELAREFDGAQPDIEKDVKGFVSELLERKIVIEKS